MHGLFTARYLECFLQEDDEIEAVLIRVSIDGVRNREFGVNLQAWLASSFAPQYMQY